MQNTVCHSVLLIDLSFVAYMMKQQGGNGMKGMMEGKNDGGRNDDEMGACREMSKECGKKKGIRRRCIRDKGMGEGKKWFSVMFVG